ncbi:MAG: DUF1015 domain-containing protein [Sphingobacteriales bacterium]|nr:DUF1015 domain-containing protein [Sphingobacteriales bacterium]
MAVIKPFRAIRPKAALASRVAAKPYDVLNSEEAREEAKGNPYSFYHIAKAEIDLEPGIDIHTDPVYQKGRENFYRMIEEGILFQDKTENYYVYKLVMGNVSQIGLVAASSIHDYFNNVIKKHELTRPEKEIDRIMHFKAVGAHTEPVFLTYPDVPEINELINNVVATNPEYDFVADDGVHHTLWVVDNQETVEKITRLFAEKVPHTYIADGHHRSASSAKIGKDLAENNPNHTGKEEYNYFLTVIFPASHLSIIDYNRVVKDLNHLTQESFLQELKKVMNVEKMGKSIYKPQAIHEFGMYLGGEWYKLVAKEGTFDPNDPLDVLDVNILQKNVLDPILGIADPRTDKRIDFVGGIRGLGELEKRINSGEMAVAFALYPVTIQQLIDIADSGKIMPPKSTWFEPKLRSGLFVHSLT